MIFFENTWLGGLLRVMVTTSVIFGGFVYLLVYAERKISAFIQDRIGPNRIGPAGIFQGVADGIKFLFKESFRPASAHPTLYIVGPCAAVFPAILAFAAVPFGARRLEGALIPLQIANLNVGVLFVLAVSSLSVFAIIIGGWAANSKYPLLGSLRAAAQIISYEIPLGLAVMSVLLLAGSAELGEIVRMQTETWFIFLCPLGFILFLVAMFAETNRLPFDLPEGESEIIGYHAEYAGMRFGMFFMAEYASMFTISCLLVLMFLGGWEFLPFFGWDKFGALVGTDIYAHHIFWIVPTLWFCAKVMLFLFVFIWVRWTLPRFRYDQLMRLGWKRLIPLSLLNLALTVAVVLGAS